MIVPFFMQSGAHVTRDIPELVRNAGKQHPGISIVVTDHVGTHPLMLKIVDGPGVESKIRFFAEDAEKRKIDVSLSETKEKYAIGKRTT